MVSFKSSSTLDLGALGSDGLSDLRSYRSSLGLTCPPPESAELVEEICWNARYKMVDLLGKGGQGIVWLARREGVDGYHTQVAVKFFSRDLRLSLEDYRREMRRVARQAQRISEIQHDSIIAVRDFVAVGETRVMVMEWVDGLDLRHLLDLRRFEALRQRLPRPAWERLNDVVASNGRDHCRLKAGVAVDILRGCLAGISALHHQGIVHCDLKPANIMIKRTGTKKVIDLDSSCIPEEEGDDIFRGTPYYMAPEQLRDRRVSFQSDIASLGYILIEMLTGRLLFDGCRTIDELLQAKLDLPGRLDEMLPHEVSRDPILFGLCRKMVAVDPADRFADADAVDLDRRLGAASFHRHLIKTDLSTEYDRELAWWISCHGGRGAFREATEEHAA